MPVKNVRGNIKYLPIIKKGAAKLIPMNEIPKYIAQPKAAAVAITADMFPNSPSHGFDRTQSPIMQVTMENMPIRIKVELKNGMTVRVFFSNS